MRQTLVTTLLAVLIALLLNIDMVQAHAELVRANPAFDSEVDQLPERIELWFTQELAPGSTATVTGPDGGRVDNDDAAIDLFDPDRSLLVLSMQAELQPGEYTVEWTTVSGEDDDTETGTFVFAFAPAATPIASPQASPAALASPSVEPTGTLIPLSPPEDGEASRPDTRAFMIAIAVGAGAAALIYGFWLLVKPRNRPPSVPSPDSDP
ncbi:hypothetical protein BH23CHL5_BH23CHL5_08130 [soil metagenome]